MSRSAFYSFHRFKCGDRVQQKTDPRHVGRVCYTDTMMVRVEWPNGWKSDHHHTELEQAND